MIYHLCPLPWTNIAVDLAPWGLRMGNDRTLREISLGSTTLTCLRDLFTLRRALDRLTEAYQCRYVRKPSPQFRQICPWLTHRGPVWKHLWWHSSYLQEKKEREKIKHWHHSVITDWIHGSFLPCILNPPVQFNCCYFQRMHHSVDRLATGGDSHIHLCQSIKRSLS